MNHKAQHVTWGQCMVSLCVDLPDLEGIGIDQIHKAAVKAGYDVIWKKIKGWEDLDDEMILSAILDEWRPDGTAILIPNLCFWKKHLPFKLDGDVVVQFVDQFLGEYKECFFNGDTILYFADSHRLFLFQHDGLVSCLAFARSSGSSGAP